MYAISLSNIGYTYTSRDNVEWDAKQEEEAEARVRENSVDVMSPDLIGIICYTICM